MALTRYEYRGRSRPAFPDDLSATRKLSTWPCSRQTGEVTQKRHSGRFWKTKLRLSELLGLPMGMNLGMLTREFL